jgi:hypothetical protein
MKIDLYKVFTEQPENMGVGTLNQVVRALREELYQKQLKIQKLEEKLSNLVKTEIVDSRTILKIIKGKYQTST